MSSNLMLISSIPAALSAEQIFRASCGTYLHVLDTLNFDIAHKQVTDKSAAARIKELQDAEKGAVEAFRTLISGQPNELVILTYFNDASSFFKTWNACLHQGVDPLAPKVRRRMKVLFDKWKASEYAYARAGYRTISFDEWNDSMSIENDDALRPSAICLMVVARNKDEQPVLHAVATQRKYAKLKI